MSFFNKLFQKKEVLQIPEEAPSLECPNCFSQKSMIQIIGEEKNLQKQKTGGGCSFIEGGIMKKMCASCRYVFSEEPFETTAFFMRKSDDV